MTSKLTASTSGMLSQAIQTPIVSVNLSITRTVLMRAGDCSGISSSQTSAGADLRPRCHCKVLLFGADLCGARLRLGPVVVRHERVRRGKEALCGHHHARGGPPRVGDFLFEQGLSALPRRHLVSASPHLP